MGQQNYPECVECVLVVRAPRSMYTLWNLGVKRMLPERSISKVRIAGNDFESQLAEVCVHCLSVCSSVWHKHVYILCKCGNDKAMLLNYISVESLKVIRARSFPVISIFLRASSYSICVKLPRGGTTLVCTRAPSSFFHTLLASPIEPVVSLLGSDGH